MLDPSSRGMSKQIMLDWMRINHPQTPIKSGLNKNDVAKIVREMQPEYFPDPDSDAPALDLTANTCPPTLSGSLTRSSHNVSSPPKIDSDTPLSVSAAPPSCSETKIDIIGQKKQAFSNKLDHDRLFKHSESGRFPTSVPQQPKMMEKKSLEKKPDISGQRKRVPSIELDHDRCFQSSDLGNLITNTSEQPLLFKKARMEKKAHLSNQKKQLLPNEPDQDHPLKRSDTEQPRVSQQDTLEKKSNIGSSKKRTPPNEVDQHRLFKRPDPGHLVDSIPEQPLLLKKEKRSKSGKPHLSTLTSRNGSVPEKSISKSISAMVGTQASENRVDHVPALIDVSEINWMDTPNPVVGQDIPAVEMPRAPMSGKFDNRKSGVEVFQEERQRAQQIRQLEESVEDLRLKLEMNVKSDMSVLAEEMRREEEVRLLQVSVADLEQKVDKLGLLQLTVTNLDAEVTRLRKDLSAAVEDIRAQEDVIERLINVEMGDEISSADGSSMSSEL